ncbi:MAG: MMPL family transporter [Candidatus Binatia bacterium]|nr:MMPL family transporter [Candidatus Binatia bacterium]
MEQVYHYIVNRPRRILLCVVLLTGFWAYHARHIRLDSSVESLLPQHDPEQQYYAEVRQLFGSDEVGVVGVVTDDVYTPEVLHKIKRLTEAIEKVDGVERVLSLANAVDPVADVVDPPLLMPHIPTTPEALAELRKKVADRPIYVKNLVSADGRAAAINIFFANLDTDEFIRRGIDQAIEAIIARERGPEQLYYTGLPHFKVYSTNAMWGDLTLFLPLTLLLITGVLLLSFRSVRGVLLPTVTVVVSVIWTLGVMVLAGSRLSIGSIALPPLVLVLGTAYSLHVVAEYYELAHPGRSVGEVVLETLRATTPPLFMAAFTTVLGFLSLVVNQIVSIRELGLYASIGIATAFVLSIVLVPALLMLLHLPSRRETAFSPRLSATLQAVGGTAIRFRKAVIAGGMLVAVLSCWQTFSIQVDSNFQSFFRPHDPIRQATEAINRHLTGSMAFYVVIDGREAEIMKKWDTLRRIKELQRYIDGLPGVEKTISFVDYCEMLDRGAQQGSSGEIFVSPEGEILPAPRAEVQTTFWDNPDQLRAVMQLVAGSPKSFSLVVSPDFSRANIVVRTSLSRSSEIAATVEQIQAFAHAHFPPELTVRATGNLILLTRTTGDIVSGQIESLALTAGVIFALMAAMFLSVRVGIIAMIPNLFPILVFFGLMGASGAVLNFGTNIIASIALGIAVDDTIHLMARLSGEVRATANQETALLRTLSTVGKPAVYASVMFFLGFLTLSVSTFVPIQEFGLLSAATMVVGLISEIVLLPALLATTPIITLWDLLYLKLGKDPHKTIPLFEGLRPIQAKIVTLMGRLKTFARGQRIIRQGEVGQEMYVLISGTAEVLINGRYVRTLKRGDVFGEMGLIRRHERTADVVAGEDVEVIAVDERFLSRMQRRYPRIGAKIFLNIAKILSDRLQEAQRTAA